MKKKQLEQIFTVPFEFALLCWGDPDINLVDDTTRNCFFAVWALCNREYTEAMNREMSKCNLENEMIDKKQQIKKEILDEVEHAMYYSYKDGPIYQNPDSRSAIHEKRVAKLLDDLLDLMGE